MKLHRYIKAFAKTTLNVTFLIKISPGILIKFNFISITLGLYTLSQSSFVEIQIYLQIPNEQREATEVEENSETT